jgi:hypothetical protein
MSPHQRLVLIACIAFGYAAGKLLDTILTAAATQLVMPLLSVIFSPRLMHSLDFERLALGVFIISAVQVAVLALLLYLAARTFFRVFDQNRPPQK